ncbi:MAG: hypothetical protein WC637_17210 [Victivallales bacterium]
MSDNNTSHIHRKKMNNRLAAWSFRLLAALAVCFLAGCRMFTVS